ncbi:MAG: dolichyl-phosphate beta-glucosyltransferase [Thermoguttaceae bacterium]|jgi:dolichyl-phosphate beta-glucosyltransferase
MPEIALSLILPAFDEARRLPSYLESVRAHFEQTLRQPYEVIVVDDGSRDETAAIAECLASHWPQLRLLRHAQNEGKGAAVRTGVLAARGELLLFADADGATPIEEHSRLAAAIAQGADVAIGSRLAPDPAIRRSRHWCRGLAGKLFALAARRLLRISALDTQCGFKMFRAAAGRRLFATLKETGYLFDLELLVLAERFGLRVVEVPIHWQEVPGGHLHPLRELPRIVAGLWRLRRR